MTDSDRIALAEMHADCWRDRAEQFKQHAEKFDAMPLSLSGLIWARHAAAGCRGNEKMMRALEMGARVEVELLRTER